MAQKRVVEEIEVDLVEEEDMIDGAEKALVLAGNVDVKKRLGNSHASDWRRLISEHLPLVMETLTLFGTSTYRATQLKFLPRFAECGFPLFPPRSTLDRWAKNVDSLEPARGVQGGPKPTLLSQKQTDVLLLMIRSTRVAGVPVHWRTVKIYVIGLLRSDGIFLRPERPSKSYCSTFLTKNGFASRAGTKTARRETIAALEEIESKHLLKLAFFVARGNVPDLLVFNFDEQGMLMWNCSKTTMEAKGAKDVAIKGLDDKRQITVRSLL